MRPAWTHSYGCKSRRKLITTNEAKFMYDTIKMTAEARLKGAKRVRVLHRLEGVIAVSIGVAFRSGSWPPAGVHHF